MDFQQAIEIVAKKNGIDTVEVVGHASIFQDEVEAALLKGYRVEVENVLHKTAGDCDRKKALVEFLLFRLDSEIQANPDCFKGKSFNILATSLHCEMIDLMEDLEKLKDTLYYSTK